jgi:hypothetical protein
MIEAERELLNTMRTQARRRLGSEASAGEVETLAQELYEGPKRIANEPETPLEQYLRRQAAEGTHADAERYGR